MVSFVPQILKSWRSKSVDDLAIGTFILITAGSSLKLIYVLLYIGMDVLLLLNYSSEVLLSLVIIFIYKLYKS